MSEQKQKTNNLEFFKPYFFPLDDRFELADTKWHLGKIDNRF